MDVDDTRVFKVLDLGDIERTFSAYQRQQVRRVVLFVFLTPMMSSTVRDSD